MDSLPQLLARGRRLASLSPLPLRRAAALAVTDDRWFLVLVTAFNLFLVRRSFAPGIWADNDSVGHLAYATYLRDEFYPQTGTFLGFCPKYNLGLPFLLFNTPPLLYVVTAATSLALGISVLASLKACVIVAYLAVPALAGALVRTFDERPGHLFKFAVATFSLFSSELFGLEFFFHNGMLNPAFALPWMLATLIAQRRAVLTPGPRCLWWIVLAGLAFATTLLTHTLTAYMTAVTLVGVTVGDRPRRIGANAIALGATLGLGVALAGFWLYPSLAFGAKTDAAYTWIRDPKATITTFFDGTLLSSFWGSFFPSFAAVSRSGSTAVLAAAIGVVAAARRRAWVVFGFVLTAALALWIACGPSWSAVIGAAPMYERLLWYRFVTLAIFATLAVASYGAWRASGRDVALWPANWIALGVAALWATFVMTERAVKIETASAYPQFQQSVDRVVARLNARPKDRPAGRVFSEFLGFNTIEASSVNYPREMLPVLTGLDEVGGWIYENNPAGQVLLRKGPFWYNGIPILELADAYDLEYVVAGTPNLVRALANDPRWQELEETPDLVLFQARRPPRFAEADGFDVDVVERAYVRGGGYRMKVRVAPSPARGGASDAPGGRGADGGEGARWLSIKTNHSTAWRATAGGEALAIRATPNGLLEVELPERAGAAPVDVAIEWNIDALRSVGDRVSLAGLGLAAALALLGLRKRWPIDVPQGVPLAVGATALAAGIALLGFRARGRDLSRIGFGIADGMTPVLPNDTVRVGTFDDDAPRPNRVVEGAWSARRAIDGRAFRELARPDAIAARVTLSPSGRSSLRVTGRAAGGGAIRATLLEPGSATVACEVTLRAGELAPLPAACAASASNGAAPGPGRIRDVRLAPDAPLEATAIDVVSDIAYVEAESFRNVSDESGLDAFYSMGAVEYSPANGVAVTAAARYGSPIEMRKEIRLAPGDYEAWGLVRSVHPRFRNTRGDIELAVDDAVVGTVDGASGAGARFWDSLVRFDWERFGTARVAGPEPRVRMTFKKRPDSNAALVDVDVLAFVPKAAEAAR